MNLRRSILVSLAIIAGFTGFGFLYSEHPFRPPDGPEPVIAFGAVGLGLALAVLVGVAIIGKVRINRMPRFLGALLLLLSSGLSVFTPFPIIRIAADATKYSGTEGGFSLFGGEHGQWVFVIAYGFWCTLTVFAFLLLCIFTVGRSKAQQGGST